MLQKVLTVIVLLKEAADVAAIFGECVSLKNNANNEKFQLVYQWNYINFTWPSKSAYETALQNGKYIPENNIIAGVKYFNEKFYLALPKTKAGTPVTLARVNQYTEEDIITNPLLTPYPSWKVNTDSGCNSLQDVQSMEIDRKGTMWVLDGRRINNSTKCPPKIVLLDLNAAGRVIKSFVVPNEICKHDSCFLNDLVVDEYDGGYAFITDASHDPGLIVYSRKLNRAWKVRDESMHARPDQFVNSSNEFFSRNKTPIDGITMAPATSLEDSNRVVYYTALVGLNIYGINSSVLRNEKLAKSPKVKDYIIDFGQKSGPSDGLAMDTEGELYFGLLTDNAVGKWDTSKNINTATVIDKNDNLLNWPDSFGFDPFGNLYLIANNIGHFLTHGISIKDINFKLLKLYTGTCSYLY